MPNIKKDDVFSLLGINSTDPDLLDEALAGKIGAPTQHPADLSCTQTKQEIHQDLNKEPEAETPDLLPPVKSEEPTKAAPITPTPDDDDDDDDDEDVPQW